MKRKALHTLIAVNVVMLLALVFITLTPAPAQAQFSGAQYIMVGGAVAGRTQQNAVYIIELQTARMITIFYNGASKRVEVVGQNSILDDIQNFGSGK